MTEQWSHVLSSAELVAHHALTNRLDPSFAKRAQAYWESRTLPQLHTLQAQAWRCNDPTCFQLARSYAALKAA